MGGALAELEALSLVLRLPSQVDIRTVVFGAPRLGNPAYAKFFDAQVPNFKRINNKRGMCKKKMQVFLVNRLLLMYV